MYVQCFPPRKLRDVGFSYRVLQQRGPSRERCAGWGNPTVLTHVPKFGLCLNSHETMFLRTPISSAKSLRGHNSMESTDVPTLRTEVIAPYGMRVLQNLGTRQSKTPKQKSSSRSQHAQTVSSRDICFVLFSFCKEHARPCVCEKKSRPICQTKNTTTHQKHLHIYESCVMQQPRLCHGGSTCECSTQKTTLTLNDDY